MPDALLPIPLPRARAPHPRTAWECVNSAASSLWRINLCERHLMARLQLSHAYESLREAAEQSDDPAIAALIDDCRRAADDNAGWPHVDGLYERACALAAEMRRA